MANANKNPEPKTETKSPRRKRVTAPQVMEFVEKRLNTLQSTVEQQSKLLESLIHQPEPDNKAAPPDEPPIFPTRRAARGTEAPLPDRTPAEVTKMVYFLLREKPRTTAELHELTGERKRRIMDAIWRLRERPDISVRNIGKKTRGVWTID